MPSPRRGLLVPVLLASAGLAVAGCGGASEGDYVKTYESACKSLITANSTFRTKLEDTVQAAGNDKTKVVSAVKSSTGDYLDSLSDEVKKLGGADAPKKFQKFQDAMKSAAGKLDDRIDDTKNKIDDAKTIDDFSSLRTAFSDLQLPKTTPPADLQKKIPSCKFGNGS